MKYTGERLWAIATILRLVVCSQVFAKDRILTLGKGEVESSILSSSTILPVS